MIKIIVAEQQHIGQIIPFLRDHEKLQIAKSGFGAEDLLRLGVDAGHAWTALVDATPAAMWGVRKNSVLGRAQLWLVTTWLVNEHALCFVRESHRFTRWAVASFGTLEGFVHCGHHKSADWLEWLGFTPIGLEGEAFRYELRADDGN